MTKREIVENVKQLSRKDQVDLTFELWELVEVRDDELALTDEQKAELDRRIEAHERNPGDARPWDQVKEEIKRELRTK